MQAGLERISLLFYPEWHWDYIFSGETKSSSSHRNQTTYTYVYVFMFFAAESCEYGTAETRRKQGKLET